MLRVLCVGLAIALTHSVSAQTVRIDSVHHEVIVTVGPLRIPASTPYDHHVDASPLDVFWPVSGWVRGYRIELVDSTGTVLPREMLHHVGVANLDRRQLLYPMAERLFAAGRETGAVTLPGRFGVPLSANQHLLLYYALVNPTDRDVDGASLTVTVGWIPSEEKTQHNVLPLAMDAAPFVGQASTFDVKPGITVVSSDFTLPVGGRLRELGGHLHDYGIELRLEDVASGKVLARLGTSRFPDGRLRSVDRTRFLLKWRGLHLAADHRYRVVGVYDNPTCATIPGAMAGLVGVFEPDDLNRWPAIDQADSTYRQDLMWLRDQGSGRAESHHDHPSMSDTAQASSGDAITRSCGLR